MTPHVAAACRWRSPFNTIMTNTETTRNDTWDTSLQKGYDEEARRYDARRYHSAEGRLFNDLELRILAESLRPREGMTILDLPTGTGRLSVGLSRLGARVVGGDISGGMLRAAAAKAGSDGLSRIHFAQMNAGKLPFADNTFDGVISFKFFHLIPNDVKATLLGEMIRVLKPGRKLIVEFNSPFYGGVLAFLRYYFRKKHPGGMRMKCLFPDQVHTLFKDVEVTGKFGVKLPLSGYLGSVLGQPTVEAFNLWFGRIPAIRYLSYAVIVEAVKPEASA
jgi:ubiquinone/menaquinone biosynthesis C-methylase UbiE